MFFIDLILISLYNNFVCRYIVDCATKHYAGHTTDCTTVYVTDYTTDCKTDCAADCTTDCKTVCATDWRAGGKGGFDSGSDVCLGFLFGKAQKTRYPVFFGIQTTLHKFDK